jgi:tetratricopeptide (TPR) repeat protein
MKHLRPIGLGTFLLCSASPAIAGTDPLYQAPPAWVDQVDLKQVPQTGGETVLVVDNQKRLEAAKVWDYSDIVYRIDSPDALTAAGTLSASWSPDKGDLMVNRVQIIRDGKVIDVIANGGRFTVLRREQQLEQREINGVLTATLAVPGLRIGDLLRVTYTTVQGDQALGDKLQAIENLPSKPLPVAFARVAISWPKNDPIEWRAGPNADFVKPELRGGYEYVEVMLPLEERKELPEDAPLRFRFPPMLQAGSFASWKDVSGAMAPLFSTKGAIARGSELAKQVDEIEATSRDPLKRAAIALRQVQDQVSYLANGLDGGNYIPQSPAETWDKRYGDCKAKSLLLLAMLRQMGIEAEAVLVHHSAGDAVPSLLPMPADFDHVIVRATIGGKDYWLDGTNSGTRLSNIGEVPAFRYALPLKPGGADLVAMAQRELDVPDRELTLAIDESAGIDLPALFEMKAELSGALGAGLRPIALQSNEKFKDSYVKSLVNTLVGNTQVLSYTISYDDEQGTALVDVKGLMNSNWQFERGLGSQALPSLPSAGFEFSPDRARKTWKDIPVEVAGPYLFRTRIDLKLPNGGQGFELRGTRQFDGTIAGTSVKRAAAIEGDTLKVDEQASFHLTEIAPADILPEKAKAARFNAGKLTLRAPKGVQRSWQIDPVRDKARIEPIEAAFAQLIAKDPLDETGYLGRAAFRAAILDRAGALADYDKAITISPSTTAYFSRANLYRQMGKPDQALEDVRHAFELDPTTPNALAEADSLADLGRFDEALGLIETYEDDSESRLAVLQEKANVLGMSGKAEQGLEVLQDLLAERPGDPDLLNTLCWHMGVWQLNEEAMLPECTKAVESAGWSPPVLDSRGMAYFRLGRLDDALADYNAALNGAPDLAPTLFMRGIVRSKIGDAAGRDDIKQALRMSPSLARQFARYGIEPPGT